MTLLGTQLEPAIEKIEELLEASGDLQELEVTVLWGPPTGDDAPKRLIAVGSDEKGDSGSSERSPGPIGGKLMLEELSIPITIQVLQEDGTSLRPAYKLSREITDAAQEAIREDDTLGGILNRIPAEVAGVKGRYIRKDKARGHTFSLTVTGSAQI